MIIKNKKQSYRSSQAGFTLVELMVSLTLFVVVVLAVVSSLYSVNNASRKISTMRSVMDNLNFAVESIGRTIRTGSNIVCGGTTNGNYSQPSGHNCRFGIESPSNRISVHSTVGRERDVEYRLNNNAVYAGAGQIEKRTYDNGVWSDWVALTAPEINIQQLSFYVSGADLTDNAQPYVIMFIKGMASISNDSTAPFAIQTFISQRAAE